MLKLYYHPSPNPAKVALFLEESGLPYPPLSALLGIALPILQFRDCSERSALVETVIFRSSSTDH